MRRIDPKNALDIINIVVEHITVIDEKLFHDKAAEIALLTGCRAVDAYYIATAKHVGAILITSDRTMRDNASKSGVEAYYLLSNKDYKTLKNRLSQ